MGAHGHTVRHRPREFDGVGYTLQLLNGSLLAELTAAQRETQQPYDACGQWAAAGRVDDEPVATLLAEPFMAIARPERTGRDLFNAPWLQAQLARSGAGLSAGDVMATLAEFTARGATEALRRTLPSLHTLLVCGGGAFNAHLMARLSSLVPAGVEVQGTASRGGAPDRVEALAFAWLAREHLAGRAGNLPAVTGTRGPRVLGTLYPA